MFSFAIFASGCILAIYEIDLDCKKQLDVKGRNWDKEALVFCDRYIYGGLKKGVVDGQPC
jgi:hypothetical protein